MDENEATELRLQLMALHRHLRAEHRQDAPLNEMLVLGAIDRLGHGVHPTDVAADLRMASSNLATLLRQLERKNLVVSQPDPDDRRRRTLALTTQGTSLLSQDRGQRETWLRARAHQVLSPAEERVLIRAGHLIQRLADDDETSELHGIQH